MKSSGRKGIIILAVVQVCAAFILGVYAFAVSTSSGRARDNFERHKQEVATAKQQAKSLEEQLALSKGDCAAAAYDDATTSEHFSTSIFVFCVLLVFSGAAQLGFATRPRESNLPSNAG